MIGPDLERYFRDMFVLIVSCVLMLRVLEKADQVSGVCVCVFGVWCFVSILHVHSACYFFLIFFGVFVCRLCLLFVCI